MNTNMKKNNMNELSIDEMELVFGGGSCLKPAGLKFWEWVSNTAAPACQDTAKAACNIGKAAVNWVSGLFN